MSIVPTPLPSVLISPRNFPLVRLSPLEVRTLGSGVGTIDIYTVRDYSHLNSENHGTLTGIEKYSQEEFDEHTQAGISGNQPIGNASNN